MCVHEQIILESVMIQRNTTEMGNCSLRQFKQTVVQGNLDDSYFVLLVCSNSSGSQLYKIEVGQ